MKFISFGKCVTDLYANGRGLLENNGLIIMNILLFSSTPNKTTDTVVSYISFVYNDPSH